MSNLSSAETVFGTYEYDQDIYERLMDTRTVAQLLERVLIEVRDLPQGSVTKARKLRKAELAAMVAEWDTGARDLERSVSKDDRLSAGDQRNDEPDFYAEADEPIYPFDMTVPAPDDLGQRDPNEGIDEWHAFMEADQAVNEPVNGAEVMAGWLALPADKRTNSVQVTRDSLARVPSPERHYQSAMEGLAVLDAYLRKVNVTTTDVAAAGVEGLVQLGKRLVWGKLIDVVRRGTRFSPDFLVTVEVEGVRRLIKADHYLAA